MRGNLDALIAKPPLEKPVSSAQAEPSSAVNDDLPPSLAHVSIQKQLEGTEAVETEAENVTKVGNLEVEKPVEVVVETEKVSEPETADVDVTHPKSPEVAAHDPEKGKSVPEDPVITIPASATTYALVNIEKSPAGDQCAFAQDEENDLVRPDETLGD
ncbi:hypothetical protein Hanom_Chr03g00217591 [Helianthus anomalus]